MTKDTTSGSSVLPPHEGSLYGGCYTCGPRPMTLSMDRALDMGFGWVTVIWNGQVYWSGNDETVFMREVEGWAVRLPGDWRVKFDGPLSDQMYQRYGIENWVLVENGMGFA